MAGSILCKAYTGTPTVQYPFEDSVFGTEGECQCAPAGLSTSAAKPCGWCPQVSSWLLAPRFRSVGTTRSFALSLWFPRVRSSNDHCRIQIVKVIIKRLPRKLLVRGLCADVVHVAGPGNVDCTTVCKDKGLDCEAYTVPMSNERILQMFKEAGVYGGAGCTRLEKERRCFPGGIFFS